MAIPTRLLPITPNRVQLQSDIIGVLMAVGLWDKEGVIKIVDGRLRQPRKEGTENTLQDSNSTPCQDPR